MSNPQSLAGRRVVTLGGALSALTGGVLEGALMEAGGLDKLMPEALSGAALVMIDANAWDPDSLSLAIQALAAQPKPPPVLLVGAHLPIGVVRNLMRLERSDVLEAPFSGEKLNAAITALIAAPAVAEVAPTPGH